VIGPARRRRRCGCRESSRVETAGRWLTAASVAVNF
jgi:hypothetical protein